MKRRASSLLLLTVGLMVGCDSGSGPGVAPPPAAGENAGAKAEPTTVKVGRTTRKIAPSKSLGLGTRAD